MNIETLMKITGGRWIGKKKGKTVSHFSIDTRTLKKGDVFLAVKGERYDGESFLKEAERKGASFAIVRKVPKEPMKRMGLLLVEDPLESLKKIASYKRKKAGIPLIAVTGSVGKTTLKELICHILTPDYHVLKSEGNRNNQIGLPLTLLELEEAHDVIVTEMGMNHPKEIHELSMIAKPNISVITNIGTSHIGYLGSKKNIYKAKMEICDGMDSGLLIVNGEDHYLKKVKSNSLFKVLKVGGRKGEIKIKDIKVTLDETLFTLSYQKKQYLVRFPYPGKHYPLLIAMAILVGLQMKIDMETCIERLNHFSQMNGRLKKYRLKSGITLIDDSYNASFESFDSALHLLQKEKKPKLLIVGDILELGNQTIPIHNHLIKKLNRMKKTEIWLTGKTFQKLQKKVHMGTYFETTMDMKKAILENQWKDCTILVKASNGIHLDEISKLIYEKYRD